MTFEEKRIEKILSKITNEKLPIKFNKILNFKNGYSLISITCDQGHTTETVSIDNFLKRGTCPVCSLTKKGKATLKTQVEYETLILESLKERPYYRFIGFSKFNTKKDSIVNFHCDKHNVPFSMNVDNFLRNRGCFECGKERMIASKEKNQQEYIDGFIKIYGDKYLYDEFIWTGIQNKSTFICKEHNYSFQKTPANFRKTNREHCPLCSGEIDINTIPTDVYVQRITKNGLVFCKFGISTDTHRRMMQQKWLSGAEHELLWNHTFDNRIDAMRLEKLLKESVERGVVDISVLPDGFTETFDEKYLSLVLEIVNNFK